MLAVTRYFLLVHCSHSHLTLLFEISGERLASAGSVGFEKYLNGAPRP
jgi:hypothetical protein